MKEASISKKKASIINLIINYANTFFLVVNGLILVPVYFKFFSLSIYGSYLATANIVGILSLLEFGLSLVLTQKLSYFYKTEDYRSFHKIMKAGFVISFVLISFLVIIALIISPYVPIWVKALPNDYSSIKYAFIINAVGMAFFLYSNTLTSVFQAWFKVQISGVVNVVSALLGILSTVLALYMGFGVLSISFGIFTRGLVCVIGLIPFLIVNLKKGNYPKSRVGKEIYTDLIKSSLPVFGNTVSKSLIDNIQILILTSFVNPTATAIFALTTKVYQLCNNLLAPIGSSIFSSLSQLVSDKDKTYLNSVILKVFSLFTLFSLLLLTTGFALNNSFMSLWVGSDKSGGFFLSLMVCINMFVSTRFAYMNFNLFALGVFGKTVFYDQLGAICRLILIFSLIRTLGIVAIPISELIATLIFSGYFLNRLFIQRMQFNRNEAVQIIFGGVVEFGVFLVLGIAFQSLFPHAQSWLELVLQSVVFVIIIFISLLFLRKDILLDYGGRFLKRVKG